MWHSYLRVTFAVFREESAEKIFLDFFNGYAKMYLRESYAQFDTMKRSNTMISKTELPACPVETTLMLIGDKWKVLILRDLRSGTKRFGELKKSVTGISQKVLTANLRDMEGNGILTREVFPEVPPRVEYTLTDLGRSMMPILDAMEQWGTAYKCSYVKE